MYHGRRSPVAPGHASTPQWPPGRSPLDELDHAVVEAFHAMTRRCEKLPAPRMRFSDVFRGRWHPLRRVGEMALGAIAEKAPVEDVLILAVRFMAWIKAQYPGDGLSLVECVTLDCREDGEADAATAAALASPSLPAVERAIAERSEQIIAASLVLDALHRRRAELLAQRSGRGSLSLHREVPPS